MGNLLNSSPMSNALQSFIYCTNISCFNFQVTMLLLPYRGGNWAQKFTHATQKFAISRGHVRIENDSWKKQKEIYISALNPGRKPEMQTSLFPVAIAIIVLANIGCVRSFLKKILCDLTQLFRLFIFSHMLYYSWNIVISITANSTIVINLKSKHWGELLTHPCTVITNLS